MASNTAIRNSFFFLFVNANFKETFAHFITAEWLYNTALAFGIITMAVVISTYILLYIKKRNYVFRRNIREALEQWIAEVILNDSGAELVVPSHLKELFKLGYVREMLIEELMKEKASFSGEMGDNIVKIYDQLGLDGDSRVKLENSRTYIQCKGIHELCVMEQKDHLTRVYRLTNSQDKDVRLEAQTAVIQWYGFRGLRFLDVVTYPISEFQQLKLLELLRPLKFTGLPKLASWIQSKNDTVADFALKLAEHYKQTQVHDEAAACLSHPSEAVRTQAVKTLAAIPKDGTADLISGIYRNESFTNQLNILAELQKIAGESQKEFLLSQLKEGHEKIKLAAAKALAKRTFSGMRLLQEKALQEPVPYSDIYLHVKSEVGK